ncbi:gamma-glutamyl-gamma-aminobutyrate hydrolase family protein [Burkholderia sp. L27(2015)]|uniref:gamma-glutamyl-gamma-aminobutyrate hydrolase family protein n=1 Tax=Burkholderia sp. L27(2015) TaxID=1641858 RepID=UPI00131A7CD3|nr:type 1 glutamine amidotransferase [Burkholderia sp. L27(2015)]
MSENQSPPGSPGEPSNPSPSTDPVTPASPPAPGAARAPEEVVASDTPSTVVRPVQPTAEQPVAVPVAQQTTPQTTQPVAPTVTPHAVAQPIEPTVATVVPPAPQPVPLAGPAMGNFASASVGDPASVAAGVAAAANAGANAGAAAGANAGANAGAAAGAAAAAAAATTGGTSSGPSAGYERPAYLNDGYSAWGAIGRRVMTRAQAIFDRAGKRMSQRTLKIGVSARIFHPEPEGKGLRGKTLQYLEESIAHWVMSRDVLVFMIPTVGQQGMIHPSNIRLRDYAKHLDGLLLQGGADVSPQSYAEAATRPEWHGDRVRDMYELELLHEFIESGKPVLGVCRGCQLINVAFGGTLYQDIATDVETAIEHVNELYDQHRHVIQFPPGSSMSGMFAGQREGLVNSIHHQAVRTVGRDLSVEAVSAEDGIIEAVRYKKAPFVMGVQWHPEFHRAGGPELLDCTPVLDNFLRAARDTRF